MHKYKQTNKPIKITQHQTEIKFEIQRNFYEALL